MTTRSTNRLSYANNRPLQLSANAVHSRFSAMALAIAGILLAVYPAVRPFSDETTLDGAAAFASAEWIVSHTLAILGFVSLALGLFGLYLSLKETTVERLAYRGLVLSWSGVGLTLPFYGAEVFGLNAIGREALKRNSAEWLSLADDIRFGFGFLVIVAGLVLLAAGCILVAVAVWKSHSLAKWSGIPLAAGFLLYLPQYAAAQPIRVVHGILIMIGCLWLAISLHVDNRRRRNDLS